MKKLILTQFFVLLAGALFAWTNFTIEMVSYLNNESCPLGCNVNNVNPVYTPCFYGALFFTLAFILSLLMVIKNKKQTKIQTNANI